MLIGDPIYWISYQNTVYRLTYNHKELDLFPNICKEPELVVGLDHTSLTNVVKKYHKSLRYFDLNFRMFEHPTGVKTILLDEYFQKGFFFKGRPLLSRQRFISLALPGLNLTHYNIGY